MPLGQTDHTGKHAYRWTITCRQRCFNAGTPSTTLAQHLVILARIRPTVNDRCTTQQTRDVDPMFFQCRADVGDRRPTFKQHWIIVGHMSYTVLAGWYCYASEAGQSTEGQSVLQSCIIYNINT